MEWGDIRDISELNYMIHYSYEDFVMFNSCDTKEPISNSCFSSSHYLLIKLELTNVWGRALQLVFD